MGEVGYGKHIRHGSRNILAKDICHAQLVNSVWKFVLREVSLATNVE